MDHTQAASDDDHERSTAPGDTPPAGEQPFARSGPPSPASGIPALIGDGRYRMTRRLGRGGMAEVYAAEDVRLGRTVAVKLMRGDLVEDPVAKTRFTREAQSVAGLNHHAIVAVYDSGEDRVGPDAVPYIVMELCEGRTIRDLLVETEPPPVEQALIIVSGVLEALAYSHQHGIVHRDIKPANVVITNAGAVKVMDFGIARALHGASTTMTQTGMVMGTPQYLSPEQALGKAIDHRSDLYATGCLLYELLALRPPFTGETPLSVVYQHVQDDPRPPSVISDRVPPELDGLVLRALAKNPDDRFQSAEEMRGLVQHALRMLGEQGGWTGAWDTGYVDRTAPTAALPGAAATSVLPGVGGNTAELGPPLIMGPPAGAAEPAGYDGDYPPRHRGRNAVLLLVAAVVAVGLGIFFAKYASHQGGHYPAVVNPSHSTSADTSGPTGAPADTGGQDDTTSTGSPSWSQTGEPSSSVSASTSPSTTPSIPANPSHSQPADPPTTPTQTGTSTTGGGGDGGGDADGGDDGGSTGSPPPTLLPTGGGGALGSGGT